MVEGWGVYQQLPGGRVHEHGHSGVVGGRLWHHPRLARLAVGAWRGARLRSHVTALEPESE